jgi:hypothetical protein
MARYGQAFKKTVVAKLLPPNTASIEEVSPEVAVSVDPLERWRAEALSTLPGVPQTPARVAVSPVGRISECDEQHVLRRKSCHRDRRLLLAVPKYLPSALDHPCIHFVPNPPPASRAHPAQPVECGHSCSPPETSQTTPPAWFLRLPRPAQWDGPVHRRSSSPASSPIVPWSSPSTAHPSATR